MVAYNEVGSMYPAKEAKSVEDAICIISIGFEGYEVTKGKIGDTTVVTFENAYELITFHIKEVK